MSAPEQSPDASLPLRRLSIRFQAPTPSEEYALTRSGVVALEQAINSLGSEGIDASIAQPRQQNGANARGIGIDDVIVNIIANAVTTLLFRVITELIVRIRQDHERSAQRTRLKEAITVRVDGKRATFPVDIPPEALYRQLSLWTQDAKPSGEIQIELERTGA